MRVLFSSTAGAGHFNPLVPFARACEAAGHDVLVASAPGLAEAVQQAGFAFEAFDPPDEAELGRVWAQLPALSSDDANWLVIREVFGRLNSTASLPRLQELCATWRPDVVVRDPSEFGAAVAAEMAGLPCVRIGIGLSSFEERAIQSAAGSVDAIRRSAGLRGDPEGAILRKAPFFTVFPESFEDPAAPGPPVDHRFAEPASATDIGDGPPAWMPAADGPLVYVTFGSVAGTLPLAVAAYHAALDALATLGVPALLTVGNAFDLDALGPAPANVRIERWVPQAEVLAHASAVVCHGGSGSTIGALGAGLPMVVVPLFADQPFNAARVEATGAGLVVTPPDGKEMAVAVTRVLEETSFRTVAGQMAAEMRAHRPIAEAVDLLAGLAAQGAGG